MMTSPGQAGRQKHESAGDHEKAWPLLHMPGHTQADRDPGHIHVQVPGTPAGTRALV